MTISGPAAGLAPAIIRGDAAARSGQSGGRLSPVARCAICLTGLVQVVLAWLKLARFAAVFPAAVVEGMLAAIGR